MKKSMLKLLACGIGSLFCLFALASSLPALTIDDSTLGANTYYGGTIVGVYDDVIGLGNFNVDQMVVTQSGSYVSIVLSGLYFGTSYASGSGYGQPGDLYISTSGWDVNNPADHARNDTFDSDEGWNYVISYLTGNIYALNFAGISPTGSEGGHWAGYRSQQAWRGGYSGGPVASATVTLDASAKTLTFAFEGPSEPFNAYEWGYHWTMACGNDVVEGGGIPVPEPATLLLFGLGLVGLAAVRRK